jgi:signal transduction histidine kinase
MLLDSSVNYKEGEKTEIYNIIKNSSNHSLYIIENILNISNIESGKLELRREYLDYCEVVKHRVYINSLLASKKGISIEFEAPADSIHLSFDKHYIAEVLDNLISNAIKYSHTGARVIVRVLPNPSSVKTEITDSGVGIPEQELSKLFQPFQKTSSVPTSGETSTGLGLAIVKKVITLHGGTVGVSSTLSVGSTFYFDLPAGK